MGPPLPTGLVSGIRVTRFIHKHIEQIQFFNNDLALLLGVTANWYHLKALFCGILRQPVRVYAQVVAQSTPLEAYIEAPPADGLRAEAGETGSTDTS